MRIKKAVVKVLIVLGEWAWTEMSAPIVLSSKPLIKEYLDIRFNRVHTIIKSDEISRILHLIKESQEFRMSQTQTPENATELDVRVIPGSQRHPHIFGVLQGLGMGESLIIKNDHDPVPLRHQVDNYFEGEFDWKYLEEGSQVFRLCFTRKAGSYGNAPAVRTAPENDFKSNLPLVNG